MYRVNNRVGREKVVLRHSPFYAEFFEALLAQNSTPGFLYWCQSEEKETNRILINNKF